MPKIKLEPKKFYGRKDGCKRCGRRRGLVRRYGLRLCRQCFRETAPMLGFRKYS
ncbi:MAG: 30S ribosomal protein S14 [Candidatus Thermoplasmatota archaeon]|nr:30S ribosomal protein S14 [Candidatus Thermoplasmatota archaeon]MCL5794198.1 30S ribosomal protein S14 [Candidatus Thermoplasmatota archaeon]